MASRDSTAALDVPGQDKEMRREMAAQKERFERLYQASQQKDEKLATYERQLAEMQREQPSPRSGADAGGDGLDGDRFARGFTVGSFHTKMVTMLSRLKRVAETPPHVPSECVTGNCYHNADPSTLSVDELHTASMAEIGIIEGLKREMQTTAQLRQNLAREEHEGRRIREEVEGLRRERVQLDSQVQRGKRIAEESQEEHSKVLIRVKQQEETIRQYESSSLGREVYDANTAAELSARVKECATLQGELHRLESVLKQRIGTQEDTQLALDNAESRIASLNDNLRTQTHAEAAAREERAAANRTLEQLQSHRDDADRVASQARQGQGDAQNLLIQANEQARASKERCDSVEGTLTEVTLELNRTRLESTRMADEIQTLRQTHHSQNQDSSADKIDIKRMRDESDHLRLANAKLGEQKTDLLRREESLKNELLTAEERVVSLRQAAENSQSKYNSLAASQEAKSKDASNLYKDMVNASKGRDQLEGQYREALEDRKQAQRKFLKTEEEAVVLRKKAADCETRLIEADSKVNRLTHERNDLDARVGERVTELNAAYESINAVKREKCALEDMLRDTESELTLLHQKDGNTSRLVKDLQAQVAVYQEDKKFADQGLQLYKTLQTDCQQLYRQVSNLQTEVSVLEDECNAERVEKERTVSALREAVKERQELRHVHDDLKHYLEEMKAAHGRERSVLQEDVDRLKVRVNVLLGEQIQERKASLHKLEQKESLIDSLETQTRDQGRALAIMQSTNHAQATDLKQGRGDAAVWGEVKRMVA